MTDYRTATGQELGFLALKAMGAGARKHKGHLGAITWVSTIPATWDALAMEFPRLGEVMQAETSDEALEKMMVKGMFPDFSKPKYLSILLQWAVNKWPNTFLDNSSGRWRAFFSNGDNAQPLGIGIGPSPSVALCRAIIDAHEAGTRSPGVGTGGAE